MKTAAFVCLLFFLFSCKEKIRIDECAVKKNERLYEAFRIYTEYSKNSKACQGFSPGKAINRIAEIENEYFNYSRRSFSKYYGTSWYGAFLFKSGIGRSPVSAEEYYQTLEKRGERPDSMHCTIYAAEALKAGFGDAFSELDARHKHIWKNREYAGWSIGYILTRYYHWKAYLIINNCSAEYDRCIRNYRKHRSYYVWKQPNIPLEGIFDSEKDTAEITDLLNQHEFGWGFSNQGIHTWIMHFDILKECNWNGTPSEKHFGYGELFKQTKFKDYHDYDSHIVIFPPEE